jgi:hypothetical protein
MLGSLQELNIGVYASICSNRNERVYGGLLGLWGVNVCDILAADIPGNMWCLDRQRFLLVIPSSLPAGQRAAIARQAFREAGQEQDQTSVVCLCGLEAELPRDMSPGPARFLSRDSIIGPAARRLTGPIMRLREEPR